MFNYELVGLCRKILQEMLEPIGDKTIAITCDTESDQDCADAMAQAAFSLDAKPLVMKVSAPRSYGKAGDIDLPVDALVSGIKGCDIWIEFNNRRLFYGDVYGLIARGGKSPRYLCLCGADKAMLTRNIRDVDNRKLSLFVKGMADHTRSGGIFRVTTPAGTELSFTNRPGRPVSAAGSTNGGQMMFPGIVCWTPDFSSAQGTLVADGSISPPLGKLGRPIELTVQNGYIIRISGGGTEARRFEAWLKSFSDPNMFLLAHVSYGFGPKAKHSGSIIEDARVWGGFGWGLGNVSERLVPDIPGGIAVASHCHGVCLNASVWQDDVMILKDGEVVGPSEELVRLASIVRN